MQIFRFHGRQKQLRAFADMGRRSLTVRQKAPLFSRHLGSGAGHGFSLFPDFSTYAYLAIWPSREEAEKQLEGYNCQTAWQMYADEQIDMLLKCIKVHGQWDDRQALLAQGEMKEQERIAVLTRAKIKFNKLARFWKYVPQSSKAIEEAEGCLFSKGIGEWPLTTLATFSIWENAQLMQEFAYKDQRHREIIHKVRQEGWFSEEMFARFQVLKLNDKKWGTSIKLEDHAETQL